MANKFDPVLGKFRQSDAGEVGNETDPIFAASEAASFAAGDKSKLDGIEAGAQVNPDISGLVPYTGAGQDVDLGVNALTADSVKTLNSLDFWNGGSLNLFSDEGISQFGYLYSSDTIGRYSLGAGAELGVEAGLDFSGLSLSQEYVFPDKSGTIALTDDIPDVSSKADKTGADDIEITDTSKGVILTSPDASRWRITVNDLGVLITTKL